MIQFGPEWEQFNQRLLRTPALTEETLRRTLTASLLLLEADSRTLAPQDTRRLAGSISQRISGSYPDLVGEVGTGVGYGIVMEFGRRVGAKMPPVEALMGWVRRHWSSGPRRAAGRNVGERQIRSRAFVLARAIQRRGIRPREYLRPAWERNRVRIQQAFARIGVRTVAYLAGRPLA